MGILKYVMRGDFGLGFWIYLVSTLLVVLICLPIHEWAHGWVAGKLGDPTASRMGRARFNPLAHIDPIGTIAIFLFGFGWAKPVPVNPRYFRNPRQGMAITALAGPLSNVALAAAVLLLNKLVSFFLFPLLPPGGVGSNMLQIISIILSQMTSLNLMLAAFNLIPIPPLDGSKILGAILPDRIYNLMLQYERYAILLVYVLMFSGILDVPINWLMNIFMRGINFLTGFVDLIAKAVM